MIFFNIAWKILTYVSENFDRQFKKILIDSFEDFLVDQDRQFQNTQIWGLTVSDIFGHIFTPEKCTKIPKSVPIMHYLWLLYECMLPNKYISHTFRCLEPTQPAVTFKVVRNILSDYYSPLFDRVLCVPNLASSGFFRHFLSLLVLRAGLWYCDQKMFHEIGTGSM